MSRLKKLNPQVDDVVTIKFKSINQIMEEGTKGKKSFHDIEEYYQIEENVKAYIAGGDFLVSAAISDDEIYKDNPYIEVKNHLDKNYTMAIHESVIESIEIRDSAETFMSHDLKIIVVRINNEMFINGHAVIWDEKKKAEESDEYINHNRRLIRMFESFITDLAVQDAFEQPKEKEG